VHEQGLCGLLFRMARRFLDRLRARCIQVDIDAIGSLQSPRNRGRCQRYWLALRMGPG
jgi:hypothetical protein